MDSYPLYITVISAKGLKNVASFFTKMDVYVIVSIDGIPNTAVKSSIDKNAGSNPLWITTNKFRFNLDNLTIKHQNVKFNLKSKHFLGDKNIGVVEVPISELFGKSTVSGNDNAAEIQAEVRVVEYNVRTTSGQLKGSLKFAYKFGENYTKRQFSPPPPDACKVPSDIERPGNVLPSRSKHRASEKEGSRRYVTGDTGGYSYGNSIGYTGGYSYGDTGGGCSGDTGGGCSGGGGCGG